MSGTQYALRFISGKYQGGEFPLRMEREITIGRSSDLDMVLVEDMVSRKHAKISTVGGAIVIQDLGSTNGTFVNGEKIKKVRLKEGDRILVGTSIIKLVTADGHGAMALSEGDARMQMEATGQRRSAVTGGRPMTGSIEEIPLPDLLQLLSTSRKTGVLKLMSDTGVGRIYLRKGQLYFATLDDTFDLAPQKAIFRLLTWTTGTFELEPPDDKQFLNEITESTEALLMEAMRQLDEINRVADQLPPRSSQLSVASPLNAPLRDLNSVELDVFQAVINYGTVSGVIDRATASDLDTYSALLSLLQREYVVVLG